MYVPKSCLILIIDMKCISKNMAIFIPKQYVPVFSCKELECFHRQRGDNHTVRHTTIFPYSKYQPINLKMVKLNFSTKHNFPLHQ